MKRGRVEVVTIRASVVDSDGQTDTPARPQILKEGRLLVDLEVLNDHKTSSGSSIRLHNGKLSLLDHLID